MSGLEPTGLVIETIPEIRDGMNEDARNAFGKSLPLGDKDLHGQLHGIMSERFGVLWELLQDVVGMLDPDAATGAALEALCALTGTARRPATSSKVTLTLTGTPATLVSSGSRAATESTSKEFATDANATITLLTSWAASTAYTLGQRRTNGGNAYVVTDPGTSAASGGPTGEGEAIVDNGVVWRFLGQGTGAVDVASTATLTGPTVALSGDVIDIVTPVSGWQGVINVLDADEGQNLESDEDLRVRREFELARAGTGPVDAVRADLLNEENVPGAKVVTVFHNPTDVTNVDGMPPHSVEALIEGGDDQDIRDQLLRSVTGGIQTHGTVSGTATDTQGIDHTIKFSRPTSVDIWVDITVEVDANFAPIDVEDQVAAALVAAGDLYPSGRDVRASAVGASAFAVLGVLGAPTVEIGTAPAPSASTTIVITARQRAVFDTSRIVVTVVEVTP
jgi:uncharacterized phage protein gp47/JayE